MTQPPPPPAVEMTTVTIEIPTYWTHLLTVLANPDAGGMEPPDLNGVIVELLDHAQQGVYRPGAWERGWLMQAFGDAWLARVEPDTDDTAVDGRVIFDRPVAR